MASNVFDYMAAAFIVGSLFVAAVIVIPRIGYANIQSVDQQQLRNVGLEVLKSMLFEKGSPKNWGTLDEFNQSQVTRFGLASSSTPLYVLDPDKVYRLVEDNPLGFLDYNTIRQLMKLDGYGFNLRIRPPFNVTIEDLSQQMALHYEVTVKDYATRPIPNAIVKAYIIYSYIVDLKKDLNAMDYFEIQETTNEIGKCTIEKTLPDWISDFFTAFITTAGDVATFIAVFGGQTPREHVVDVSIVGDQVTLTRPKKSKTPRGRMWVANVLALNLYGTIDMYNGNKHDDMLNHGKHREWTKSFPGLNYGNPLLLVFNIVSESRAELVFGPFPTYTGYRVIEYGESPQGPVTVTNLQRTVSIGDMTYIFELTLWKRF